MTTGRLTAVLAAGQRQRRLAPTGAADPQDVPDNEVAWAAFVAGTQALEARQRAQAARAHAAERRGALARKEGALAEKRGERAAKDALEAAEAVKKARAAAEAWALEGNANLQRMVAENEAGNALRASNSAASAMMAFMAAEGEMGLVNAQAHKARIAGKRGAAAHQMAIDASKDAMEAAAEAREAAAELRGARQEAAREEAMNAEN